MATDRDLLLPGQPESRVKDSPAVRAGARRMRARASILATDRIGTALRSVRRELGEWWVWTDRPASLRETWQRSAVDGKRVPVDAAVPALLWRLSNWTDRLVMLLLVLAAPTVLTGPLRWLATRPTRRCAFYVLLAVLVVIVAVG